MPCWTVTKQTVNLTNPNPAILTAALQALGFRVNDAQYSQATGQDYRLTADHLTNRQSVILTHAGALTVTGASGVLESAIQETTRAIQRAYSTELVRHAATRAGWHVRQTEHARLSVTRRY